MDVGRFLAGIGALIWDPVTDSYLLLKRSENKDFAPGAWECVTGRLDQGEGFEDALHREVMEEIGVEIDPLFIVGTTHFYRGPKSPETELIGVVFCCQLRNEEEIVISSEHDQYRWVTYQESADLLSAEQTTEMWLRRVLARAEMMKRRQPRDLLAAAREEGFELNNT